MAQLKVRWTRLALADFSHAHQYILKERSSAAGSIVYQIERALDALVHYPLMGRSGRVTGTRELYIANTPFVLAYRVIDDRVEILGFMHVARRWPDAF